MVEDMVIYGTKKIGKDLLIYNFLGVLFKSCFFVKDSVDGSEIRQTHQLRLVSLSHYVQGF